MLLSALCVEEGPELPRKPVVSRNSSLKLKGKAHARAKLRGLKLHAEDMPQAA